MEKSRIEEYNQESIMSLMKEERYGLHIGLLESGQFDGGKEKMSIVVETNLNTETVRGILSGLLEQLDKEV